ncbi:hypothetical protein [Roseibium aggregatum]|uniref:Uncharacterized protein n=1 Tax=Roseibium aggregatum TaxID=187304 RepID=A0A0M6Y8G2_9HYPH|nr:hypothetical protein [Roseibium aggregatum]CTQ45699.1 hypothetical protein LAL4801_04154 [Roseibium aggregatum]
MIGAGPKKPILPRSIRSPDDNFVGDCVATALWNTGGVVVVSEKFERSRNLLYGAAEVLSRCEIPFSFKKSRNAITILPDSYRIFLGFSYLDARPEVSVAGTLRVIVFDPDMPSLFGPRLNSYRRWREYAEVQDLKLGRVKP